MIFLWEYLKIKIIIHSKDKKILKVILKSSFLKRKGKLGQSPGGKPFPSVRKLPAVR